ncbi:hypothetical protein HHK36_026009 [Tetracentron sinense]|uniref:Uncharacterized protein n=1 Tax=Tetracentron sinense TaxID=13715 RepID=A0A834YJU3_TETSI|nr:hypothetical protein HHK36_026009 [Tetracentron sinense]
MEKQMNQAMIMAEPSSSLGVLGILGVAFKIPSRNWKLMVSIMVLFLLPVCLLTIVSDLALRPIEVDITSGIALLPKDDPSSPESREIMERLQKDFGLLLCWKLVTLVLFCVFMLFSLLATVYSTARIYTGKQLNLKELLSMIGGIWKKPLITWFYISLFSIVFVIVSVILGMILISVLMVRVHHVALISVLILGYLCYLYLATVWMLSLVVSIEEDNYGLMALSRAGELIKGKTIQGFAIMLILSLVSVVIYISFPSKRGGMNQRTETRLAIGITMVSLLCLVKLFIFMAYTVFYFECKKSHGEKVEVEETVDYYAPIDFNKV